MAQSHKHLLEALDLLEGLILSCDQDQDVADDLELVCDLSGQDRYETLRLLDLDPVRLAEIANFQRSPIGENSPKDTEGNVAPAIADCRGQSVNVSPLPEWAAGLRAWWQGVLPDMCPVQIASGNGMPLANSAQSAKQVMGVQKALVEIFGDVALADSLQWSRGLLRIMCVRMPDGLVRALIASVHRSSSSAERNSSIILHFADRHGSSATIELTPDQPMKAAQNLSLKGEMSEIELTVLLRSND
jgi:hypothetical protein